MADAAWEKEFAARMRRFERARRASPDAVAVSLKIRIIAGCFHREHSPRAYQLIDAYLNKASTADIEVVEHESGPELLIVLGVITAGVVLTKSVIELVTAIIKARSEGIKKGDKPAEPVEIIVRRIDDKRQYREEIVLRIGHNEPVDPAAIDTKVSEAIKNLAKGDKDGKEDHR